MDQHPWAKDTWIAHNHVLCIIIVCTIIINCCQVIIIMFRLSLFLLYILILKKHYCYYVLQCTLVSYQTRNHSTAPTRLWLRLCWWIQVVSWGLLDREVLWLKSAIQWMYRAGWHKTFLWFFMCHGRDIIYECLWGMVFHPIIGILMGMWIPMTMDWPFYN